MKKTANGHNGFKEILERQEVELAAMLRKRDGIVIEKSADLMDEIQLASERDLAIRTVDRESNVLRQVRAALLRMQDGGFGSCVECELTISPRRLEAVPWASRCIQCEEAAEQGKTSESSGNETLTSTA